MNNHKTSKKFVVGEVIKNVKQNNLCYISNKHKLEDINDSNSIFVIIDLNTNNKLYITYEKLYNDYTCMNYNVQQTSEYKNYIKTLYIEDNKVKSFYKNVENKYLSSPLGSSKYSDIYFRVHDWYKKKGLINGKK